MSRWLRGAVLVPAVLALAVVCPVLSAQAQSLEGAWLVIDPSTGAQVGALEIRPASGGEFSFKVDVKNSSPGGLPPSSAGTGKLSNRGGQFSWMAFDGREGRATVQTRGDRLALEIRCVRGTCTGSEFTFEAVRAPAVSAPPPVAPPPVSAPPPPPVTPAAPPAPAARVWEELRSTAGGFRVELPGAARHSPVNVTEPGTGRVAQGHQWTLELDGDWTGYIAGFSDLPASVVSEKGIDRTLRDAVDGGVKNVGGRLLSERPMTIAGYPAREIAIAAERGMTLRARVILVGSRLYQVLAAVHPTNSRLEPGEVERVLNSFRLIDR